MKDANDPRWIAVDWGTYRFRIWVIGRDNKILAQASREYDASRDGFEPALLGLISDWLPDGQATPVICCGMVDANAPSRATPCVPVDPTRLRRVQTQDARLNVHFIPGLVQRKPPDMMRGEETLIAGFLMLRPDFDGVICLPGAHSRWVHISAREIVSFATFMTGEMFALLAQHSTLSQSIPAQGWDDVAFDQAVATGLSHPASVSAKLFSLHASALMGDLNLEGVRATLSGLLIGQELGAARAYWLGQNVVVLGADDLAENYIAALLTQGVVAERLASEALTLVGLTAAYEQGGVR